MSETLWEAGGIRLFRERPTDPFEPARIVRATDPFPTDAIAKQLENEFALRSELDADWAVRPLDLTREDGRTLLVCEDPGGQVLARLTGLPFEIGLFLRVAIGAARALGEAHRLGIIHKDIKPANLVFDGAGRCWLTGFGIASRLPQESQPPAPPEVIAGTLAYMAPEQTGRMNRSICPRSDLYALGVVFYQLLTGALPFAASDPMEWVHCHVARTPVAPVERAAVPSILSALTMKLLAKNAEDRYQTARGLEADLRRCLAQWEANRTIEAFALGADDMSERLLIPEKLYGREEEIATLIAAFDRMVAGGKPEIVLVSGYSGIGKSSVVNELHRVLVEPRGLFASGKFDQLKRDIPYATLAQAFQSLVRQLLTKSEQDVAPWRTALAAALGANGQLIVGLIPELEHLIGPQPEVPALPPMDAQNRFQSTFRRFLTVFASPDHPLALFLDDLQWLDLATLAFLEQLTNDPDVRHLLLVGAYRDNEVGPSHPLTRTLETIRKSGVPIEETVLAPLEIGDLNRLVADTVHLDPATTSTLSELVWEKTGGNPFFTIQFIKSLADEGLLAFDAERGAWSWSLEDIRAKNYTDNVVDLMIGKLRRLPDPTQAALRHFACLGNSVDLKTLSLVMGVSPDRTTDTLLAAVQAGLVVPRGAKVGFLHDKVQEAAYALINAADRMAAHLRIGRLLIANTLPDDVDDAIFEIVNQFNRGESHIVSREERESIAALNLRASGRAKASIAYASALAYLRAGRALLTSDCWDSTYALAFATELATAECEFLTGDASASEARLSELIGRAANLIDRAAVTSLHVLIWTALGRLDRAVRVSLNFLRTVGIEWSPHPTDEEVHREYARLWALLGDRPIESLPDLPMANREWSATLRVLSEMIVPAMGTDENLIGLTCLGLATLSIEHGNAGASTHGYATLVMVIGSRFENYAAAARFGQASIDLVHARFEQTRGRVYMVFGNMVMPWTQPLRSGRDLVRRARDMALAIGDLTYAFYCTTHMAANLLAGGASLDEVQREADQGVHLVARTHFDMGLDLLTGILVLLRSLRGATPDVGTDRDPLSDAELQRRFVGNPHTYFPCFRYWVRKGQADVILSDAVSAWKAFREAEKLKWTNAGFLEESEFYFYGALAQAAYFNDAPAETQADIASTLRVNQRRVAMWASNCPENFADRAALIDAEIARIEGRDQEAMRLYEQAIQLSRKSEFLHIEAIAHETAAAFYDDRGFETIARSYRRIARNAYDRWGAHAKVRQLDGRYPWLREDGSAPSPGSTFGALARRLDVEAVVRASQAISGEIELDRLISTLMRIVMEHAGAERGLLVLSPADLPWVEAEAKVGHEDIVVDLQRTELALSALPISVVHYVIRTRETVLLDDAQTASTFSADAYLRKIRVRSLLCLPLIKQSELIAVLYLENNQAPHVFTRDRTMVLQMLASGAAISLENARLYEERRKTEQALRLSEAELAEGQRISRTGSWRWNVRTGRVQGSDECFRIFDLDPTKPFTLAQYVERIHPDDRPLVEAALEQGLRDRGAFQYEHRVEAADGSIKHLQTTGHPRQSEDGELHFVGTVMDVTARRRSEEALRLAQEELARASRLTFMGELAGSIIHEINQPLAAIVTNAEAGLRWLRAAEPDLAEVKDAIEQVAQDGHRAAHVVSGLRALARKSTLDMQPVGVDEVVRDVLAFLRSELERGGVVVSLTLDDSVVLADRVQLQQVILNLARNALEAMAAIGDRSGVLQLAAERTDADTVQVTISDTGMGLEPGTAARIFEPLFSTKAQGMGMGLSICRSIIEAHQGRLTAEPAYPHGAVFRFSLPSAERRTA